MTRPKYDDRGLTGPRDRDPRTAQIRARFVYMVRLAELHPDVFAELRALPDEQPETLAPWAQRWHLTDTWCLDYARAARQLWRDFPSCGDHWDCPETPGGWTADPPIPRTLKHRHHFDWLVHFQLTGDYADLATRVPIDGERKVDETPAVRINSVVQREACHTLAGLMGLTLRTTKAGRRPKS